jgi:CPA2 family monovalent cation:H+ antiporter-2
VLLSERSTAVGKSLAELNLDGRVEINSVRRRGARAAAPSPDFRFEPGDVLVLLGRPGDLAFAERRLLRG